MLDVSKWGNSSTLARSITAQDKLISVALGSGHKFKVPEKNYFYATMRAHGVVEHVKVVASSGDTLTVLRGQDNTVAQPFPAGTCIEIEWNPAQLCEYVAQCSTGLGPTGVVPGTYCMTCDTCFEVNAEGRITSVNGSKAC